MRKGVATDRKSAIFLEVLAHTKYLGLLCASLRAAQGGNFIDWSAHQGMTAIGAQQTFSSGSQRVSNGWIPAVPDLPACDAHCSKAVISCLKPRHPTPRLLRWHW
jgi:hypothetical protein